MQFDTKIALALRADLPVWQKLNVAAFLASGITGSDPALLGEPYQDASGNQYLRMVRQPMLVFAADAADLARAHARALERGVKMAVYIEPMFSTGHDAANRETVAARPASELPLVGIALHDERKLVDKVLKGLKLHP